MQLQSKPYEGLFITLEGGEGSGKSTLCKKLASELEKMGYEVMTTREPGGTPLSEFLRNLLLNNPDHLNISEKSEIFLFLAARVQHIEETILPALREKKVVICERFDDSTIAYQGCARHLGMSYVEKLCALASEGLEPDVTVILDLSPEEGLSRVKKGKKTFDRLESEILQFHAEVRQGYLHLADKHPHRIVVIDAAPSSDEVLKDCLNAIRPKLMLRPTV